MNGPLSNSKVLQAILDTLKSDTQAPRITSMEAFLCKLSSKTSNRFRVNIRDYFWKLPLTCADYLWMVNFGGKSLSLPFVFNGTCEISFPSVIFCNVFNGTCEISFPSVILCNVSNGTCEISFQWVIFCTVSNGTCEILFQSVIFALSLMGHVKFQSVFFALSSMGHVKFHFNLSFFPLSPMGHVKFYFNLSFLHCLQWDMWNFVSNQYKSFWITLCWNQKLNLTIKNPKIYDFFSRSYRIISVCNGSP